MADTRDIVVVDFQGAVQTKPRPAVVISTDLYHNTRPDVVFTLLTTDVARATEPTDYILQDWVAAGLHRPTAFRAYIGSRPKDKIIATFGHLSDRDWAEVQARLRLALAVT
jgi:mRNA interferase MazF